MIYDPNEEPASEEWLALEDADRIALVADYHKQNKLKPRKKRMHASIHAIVENQLAEGIPVIVETLERLMSEGLDRHEALHCIGNTLAAHIFGIVNGEIPAQNSSEAYYRDVAELTAKEWLEDSEK